MVLIGLAYVYQGPFRDWRNKSEATKNFLSAMDASAANILEITAGSSTVSLVKSGDRWKRKKRLRRIDSRIKKEPDSARFLRLQPPV